MLRRPVESGQYVSIRYSERLAEAGIEPSVGSKGDSYDNALAETINGLYKAEVIYRRGPWKTKQAVELATLEWVSWFNHHRLLAPMGYVPPAEFEANYHRQRAGQAAIARLKPTGLREMRGGSENLFDLFIAPSSQELEPPQKPGRFMAAVALQASTVYWITRMYLLPLVVTNRCNSESSILRIANVLNVSAPGGQVLPPNGHGTPIHRSNTVPPTAGHLFSSTSQFHEDSDARFRHRLAHTGV